MRSEPGNWLPITQPAAMFYAYEQVANRRRTRRNRRRRGRGAKSQQQG